MTAANAWRAYKRKWAASRGGHSDIIDPDAKRLARRGFMAGWRAAKREAVDEDIARRMQEVGK